MELTTVQAKLPAQLISKMEKLVDEGWYEDIDALLTEALRRYLDIHRPELMERFIREDLEWGLHGRD